MLISRVVYHPLPQKAELDWKQKEKKKKVGIGLPSHLFLPSFFLLFSLPFFLYLFLWLSVTWYGMCGLMTFKQSDMYQLNQGLLKKAVHFHQKAQLKVTGCTKKRCFQLTLNSNKSHKRKLSELKNFMKIQKYNYSTAHD